MTLLSFSRNVVLLNRNFTADTKIRIFVSRFFNLLYFLYIARTREIAIVWKWNSIVLVFVTRRIDRRQTNPNNFERTKVLYFLLFFFSFFGLLIIYARLFYGCSKDRVQRTKKPRLCSSKLSTSQV